MVTHEETEVCPRIILALDCVLCSTLSHFKGKRCIHPGLGSLSQFQDDAQKADIMFFNFQEFLPEKFEKASRHGVCQRWELQHQVW